MGIPVIIGIAGLPRSGKDTVAAYLLAKHGGYRYAFADAIVRMLNAGFETDFDNEYWTEHKEDIIPAIGKSPRELRQLLGTEWGRNLINKDLWVTLALAKYIKQGPGMVIPDVRFQNEAKFVRDRGGVIIHVDGPHGVMSNTHVSNMPITRISADLVIQNTGSLVDLHHKVDELFNGQS